MLDLRTYREAFSRVSAPEECRQAVLDMANEREKQTGEIIRGRKLLALAAAIITLMTLTATAFASEQIVSWFRNYFAGENQEITPGQMTYLDENTQNILQSQTRDGYTVTLESVFADKYTAYFKLKIQCPEGTEFCDSPWGTTPAFVDLIRKIDGVSLGGGTLRKMDDKASNNIGYILFVFEQDSTHPDAASLLDVEEYTLQIRDLQDVYVEDGEVQFDIVARGIWEFDLNFSCFSMEEVELLHEPMDYLMFAEKYTLSAEGYVPSVVEVPVRLTSFRLTALKASITYTYEEAQTMYTPDDFLPCSVVMQDGSTVELTAMAVMSGSTELRAPVPIILEDVEYVLLPDGTKLTMP